MPKKFKGENSKATEARARKSQQRDEEKQRKEKEIEDAYWKDDDKHVMRKQQRKDEKEQKRLEQLERKKELQKLHDDEMSDLKSAPGSSSSSKLTRAMITQRQEEERRAAAAAAKKEQERVHHEIPLEENVNRLIPVEGQARNVEDAISVLSVKEAEVDRHPEKRMKAAYNKFEEENLPRLKQENPNLRLSQLKQMIRKDWMKSPDNPLNQRLAGN